MNIPTYNLLYFKNLLDIAFNEFFDKYNDCFFKDANGNYVLAREFNLKQLEDFFCKSICQQLDRIVKTYDLIKSPEVYFIIGACQPRDNFLLKFKDGYFPKKLDILIQEKFQVKYFLKENDIIIDSVRFNEACLNVFNRFFKKQLMAKKWSNVIFISNKNLDCYSLFKIIKCIYGKTNCKNLHAKYFSSVRSPIVAVNEMIDKYINNKIKANKDAEFKKIFLEVKQFIESRMEQLRGTI